MSVQNSQEKLARGQMVELARRYATPSYARSGWQIASTLIPHFALNYLIYQNWSGPLWITVSLLLLNSLFLARNFVLFHDVMHGSLFRSKRLSDVVGPLLGLLVFMPAHHWQHEHNYHHGSTNDLSRTGIGDMPLLSVRQYQALSRRQRFYYRVLRHPAFFFTLHALYKLVIFPRVVADRRWPRHVHLSVHLTSLAILLIGLGLWASGYDLVFVIQLLSYALGTPVMVFLFYINHHFEQSRWYPAQEWSFVDSALHGSSVFIFPPVLRWFSASIGIHNVHHLIPHIPNYNLKRCWKENELFADAQVISFWEGLQALRLRLWDEQTGRYVGKEGYRFPVAEEVSAPGSSASPA
ncbi:MULTISPECIES: fatty acid desaturase [unclassified Pseudomonas]|uniref:fatty acid desaturase n=1 Tax=unclassified Pseudomonas TaxID=196821 RepID=UPI002447D09A|nr:MULTISPECIES: fatty acid desaturase [unclassified Pseudomonas]MDG9922791.1 fatty acid desaturase [Pseudomonas sp. GD04045]MDH0036928.1 fatty acid desaturase [Pseudomonas sp. GD04019]